MWTPLVWPARGLPLALVTFAALLSRGFGWTVFEELPNYAVRTTVLKTEAPATLAMCVKSCLSRRDCQSVSFLVGNLTCHLYASVVGNSDLVSQFNSVYFRKIVIAESAQLTCSRRLSALELHPRRALVYDHPLSGSPDTLIKTIDAVADHLHCYELCQQNEDFVCVAGQFDHTTSQCTLFPSDRRRDMRQLITSPSTDYFENNCLQGPARCQNRVTFTKYNDVVFPPFYFDKTIPATSPELCSAMCLAEPSLLCRSFLFDPANQECILSHNDNLVILNRAILPAIPRIYAAALGRPLTEFYESSCLPENVTCAGYSAFNRHSLFEIRIPSANVSLLAITSTSLSQCQQACLSKGRSACRYMSYFVENGTCVMGTSLVARTPPPRGFVGCGYFLENTCTVPRSSISSGRNATQLRQNSAIPSSFFPVPTDSSAPLSDNGSLPTSSPQPTTSLLSPVAVATLLNRPAEVIAERSNIDRSSPLPTNSSCRLNRSAGRVSPAFVSTTILNVSVDTCQLQCEASVMCAAFSYSESRKVCELSSRASARTSAGMNSTDNDFMFYEKGPTCTEINFGCTDSSFVLKVTTDHPFNGQVFVDNTESPVCTARFAGQRSFLWSLPISAEPCNTIYDGNGTFTNVVTIQYHSQLVTKNDRKYKVSCIFDLGIVNLTSNVLQVSGVNDRTVAETAQVSVSLTPPSLQIRITDLARNPVQSAVIGDTLLFSIVVQNDSSFGIGARNCFAFGELSGERMQLTDEEGCPTLPEFFRPFRLFGKTLEAEFDAFRFQSSHTLTYQCTIQYCVDACPQPQCGNSSLVRPPRIRRSALHELGSYNLRGRLQVNDNAVLPPFVEPANTICMNTSLTIILLILAALFFATDVAFFVFLIHYRRKARELARKQAVVSNLLYTS